jgi:hypothetical protein
VGSIPALCRSLKKTEKSNKIKTQCEAILKKAKQRKNEKAKTEAAKKVKELHPLSGKKKK